jgi:hypothetical protein
MLLASEISLTILVWYGNALNEINLLCARNTEHEVLDSGRESFSPLLRGAGSKSGAKSVVICAGRNI